MHQKQIVVNNLLLTYYYTEASKQKANAPILLFLHGWRAESLVWTNVMGKMSEEGYNCIALDLPGFGKSQVPKETFDTLKYSKTVVEFIKKLGITDLIAIGHSYGGRILMNIGINKTFKFKKVILVDSSGVDIDKSKKQVFKVLAQIVKPLFKPKFMRGLRAKIYKKIGADDYIASESDEFFKPTYLNITKDDYTAELNKLQTPTLIIWGTDDKATPVEMAEIIYKSITNSEIEFIEQAGHYPFLDQPVTFLDIIKDFLAS